ncbi:MAG TPA: TIM barrel protein [Phycisphaerae bacterium]|nr:TIM barrel protein [Phycisphaerae bacterium]HRS26659.1 TIM barrel protein [Phycisphaerae bacterium]HRT43150.1 TIM barrel protein [Phycisphaerae bacterium]
MNRRTFLASAVAGVTASATLATGALRQPQPKRGQCFKLNYAPHFGLFRHLAGDDLVDQLKFAADQGFTAFEDNGMAGRPVEEQEKIASAMERLNLIMGVFVACGSFNEPTFVRDDAETRGRLVAQMKSAVEVAHRVNAKWCTVVPGCFDPRVDWEYQTVNVIDNLKACAEVCEPAGLVMVLEPLNWRDHPNLFLTRISQAYRICRAVNSPSCKILDDLYHQQVTEGNLIPNLDQAWSEIGYVQVGDNPGRCEPGTGEINYHRIFRHLHAKGFQGVVGMEHGKATNSREGEQAVIDAYRACDDFEA